LVKYKINMNWETNKVYKIGDIVIYESLHYKCIAAHTSIVNWQPSIFTQSLWKQIVPEVVPEVVPVVPTVPVVPEVVPVVPEVVPVVPVPAVIPPLVNPNLKFELEFDLESGELKCKINSI
jgi:hypothetical protein